MEIICDALTQQNYCNGYKTVNDLKTSKSLSLDDIVREVHKFVMEFKFTE